MQAPAQRPSLADMHDIVLPEPVSWVPATTAWYVLFAALIAAAACAAVVAVRRHRANRYRREALARLDGLEVMLADPGQRSAALTTLPLLVKQVALAVAPRAEIASLSGERWLAWLDGTFEGDAFVSGPGRLLPEIAYASPESLVGIPDAEVDELGALLRDWIKGHHVRV